MERAAMRPTAEKEESPQARAIRRAAEIREHKLGSMDDGSDDFFIDEAVKPEGWTYEWKREILAGAEDPAYQVQLLRNGWEFVPSSRHPEMMQEGYKGVKITRKGMVLMERPAEITAEVRANEARKARLQVKVKEEQLTAPPPGQFERSNKDAGMVKIKKSLEQMDIPE